MWTNTPAGAKDGALDTKSMTPLNHLCTQDVVNAACSYSLTAPFINGPLPTSTPIYSAFRSALVMNAMSSAA